MRSYKRREKVENSPSSHPRLRSFAGDQSAKPAPQVAPPLSESPASCSSKLDGDLAAAQRGELVGLSLKYESSSDSTESAEQGESM